MSRGRSVVRNLRAQQQTLDIHWELLVWTANKRIVLLLFFVDFCLLVFICLFCEAEPKRITTTTLQKASSPEASIQRRNGVPIKWHQTLFGCLQPENFRQFLLNFETLSFWIPGLTVLSQWRFFFSPENPNFEGNLRIIQLQPEKFASFFSSHFLRTFFWVPGHQVAKACVVTKCKVLVTLLPNLRPSFLFPFLFF